MRFIIDGDYTYIGTSIESIPRYIKTNVQWVIFGMRLMDQTFLDNVLILDEPSNHLDITNQIKLMNLIVSLAAAAGE